MRPRMGENRRKSWKTTTRKPRSTPRRIAEPCEGAEKRRKLAPAFEDGSEEPTVWHLQPSHPLSIRVLSRCSEHSPPGQDLPDTEAAVSCMNRRLWSSREHACVQ